MLPAISSSKSRLGLQTDVVLKQVVIACSVEEKEEIHYVHTASKGL